MNVNVFLDTDENLQNMCQVRQGHIQFSINKLIEYRRKKDIP